MTSMVVGCVLAWLSASRRMKTAARSRHLEGRLLRVPVQNLLNRLETD